MKYIKLRSHGPESKMPVERWREEAHQYDLDELNEWSRTGHNIGFVCATGGGICVLDIDNVARVGELGIDPYETYTVRTGSGGLHLYYKILGENKKVIIHDHDGVHLGELQAFGQYVVAAGSIHPNGKPYVALNPDTPIQEITQKDLLQPFRGKCKLSDEIEKPVYTFREFSNSKEDELSRVRVEDVWDAKVTSDAGGQLFCTHPNHGSSTGSNLVINPSKNVWKCWRCNSGGGVALAIAVKYGIIDCSEARRGALRGDKYKEVLAIAREKGFIKDAQSIIVKRPPKEIVIDE